MHPSPASPSFDVRRVAALARIDLTDDEAAHFQKDLDDVLAFIEQLNELDLSGLEPMYHPLPLENVLREDVVTESVDPEALLRNAPANVQGLIRVPQMMD